MKYKVGDEVLLKAKVVGIDDSTGASFPIKVEFNDASTDWYSESSLMPDMTSVETIPQEEVMKSAYNQGLNDAWELARMILGIKNKDDRTLMASELIDIYGTNDLLEIFALTPQEALAKLKAYEDTQSKVVVGDVIVHKSKEEPFNELLVTCIYSDGDFDSVQISPTNDSGKFGGTYSGRRIKNYKKTGKHIDIQQILEQIGE